MDNPHKTVTYVVLIPIPATEAPRITVLKQGTLIEALIQDVGNPSN